MHPEAGIDIGNESHYAAVPSSRDSQPVRCFGCTTVELRKMAAWLKQCGIRTVALQSTFVPAPHKPDAMRGTVRQPEQHPRLRGPLLHRLAEGTRLDNNAPPTPPSFHNRWIWFIAHLRSRVWLVWLLPVPFPAAGSRCLCSPGLRRGYERTRWCRPERGWC